jgi:hypothetical protein
LVHNPRYIPNGAIISKAGKPQKPSIGVCYLFKDEFDELKEETIVIENMKQLGLDPKLVAENWKYTHMASLSRALDGRDPILHSWVSPDGLHRVICTDNNIIYFKMNDVKNWVEQGRVVK